MKGGVMDSQRYLASVPHKISEAIEQNDTKTESNHEYLRYLQSSRWRTLARAVRIRAKGKCDICLRADGTECAHLTYERVFNERITDLLWLCKKCHRALDNE
jgi:hypothetical protein